MKKEITKKINKIFIILIILILILIIALIVMNTQSKANVNIAVEKLEYIYDSEQWDEDTAYPEYALTLHKEYQGELTEKSIEKSMYYVATEVLPQYYTDLKDATEDEIIEYYTEEKDAIYVNLAIDSQTKFVNLIKGLQNLSGETLTFESYRIDQDTIQVGANYTKAVLYITYENNDEIALNITVKNKVSEDCSSVVYTIKSSN